MDARATSKRSSSQISYKIAQLHIVVSAASNVQVVLKNEDISKFDWGQRRRSWQPLLGEALRTAAQKVPSPLSASSTVYDD